MVFNEKERKSENFLKFFLPIMLKNMCIIMDVLLNGTGKAWEMLYAVFSWTRSSDFHSASLLQRPASG